jgi:hypothetical protein
MRFLFTLRGKMRKKLITSLLLIITIFFQLQAADAEKYEGNIKLLVLIIASDNPPVYLELEKIWRSYMHLDPEHVEAYFIRGNPELETTSMIDGDTIWSKTDEGWSPETAGIINKTVLSLEELLPRLDEFDYVLRTNLSSFFIFPRLLNALENLPRTRLYYGSPLESRSITGPKIKPDSQAQGSGIIMSTDVAKMLIDDRVSLINHRELPDDILIYYSIERQGIPLICYKRMDFLCRKDWNQASNQIPKDVFHIRVKTPAKRRLKDDIFIHKNLLEMFYPQ